MALVVAGMAVVASIGATVAHNGIVDLVITPPVVAPGAEIAIQGGALWTELPIEVTLVHQDGGSRHIATGMTAGDGSLYMTAVLPTDIPDGPYQVIVTNPYGEATHGAVIVRSDLPTLPIAIAVVAIALVGLVVLRLATGRSRGTTPPAQEPPPPTA